MLIAFSGLKGSGKDTAAAVLIKEYGFTKVALADTVRDFTYAVDPIIVQNDYHPFTGLWVEQVRLQELIDEYGWDKCKREIPECRRLQQAVGTEGGRALFGDYFWIGQLHKRYPYLFEDDTRYVLTDARFKNEGDFVRSGGGTLLWINRPGLVSDGHASETEELRPVADYYLNNDTTQAELEEDVRFFAFMRNIDKRAT